MAPVLLAVLLLAACAEPPLRLPVERWIEETPPESLDLRDFSSQKIFHEWRFTGDTVTSRAADWSATAVAAESRSEKGWRLEPLGQRAKLELSLDPSQSWDRSERPTAFDAGRVHQLAVNLEGRQIGRIELSWIGRDDRWSERLDAQLDRPGRYVFPLDGHPEWKGLIRRLKLTFWTAEPIHLSSIRLLHETLEPAVVEELLARPWRVELADEQRPAFASLPDHPIRRSLKVPDGADLRFAWGAVGEPPPSLRFQVRADGEMLFDRAWNPHPERTATAGWRSAKVDLSPFAGREITLSFDVQAEQEIDPRHALPVWAHLEILAEASPEEAGAAPPNIVLIVLDTLRADRMSLYGHHRETTPTITAWAEKRAAVFDTAVAAAGSTLPSHVSLFTGLDAYRHGVLGRTRSIEELTLLAERLRAEGYATAAYTGGGNVDHALGFDQGFDSYRSWRRTAETYPAELPDVINRSVAALERLRDRPFFLFVHTYAAHSPYEAWQPHFNRFSTLDPLRGLVYERLPGHSNASVVRMRDGDGSVPLEGPWSELAADQYDAGIARLDSLLETLLDALDRHERTIVVITSDHGEMLGERRDGDRQWQHGQLYDPVLLVPLLIATPDGLGAGRRIGGQARGVDLLPTLLELAGLDPVPGLDGASLVPALRGEEKQAPAIAWSYGGAIESSLALRLRNRWKLLLRDGVDTTRQRRSEGFAVGERAGDELAKAELPEAHAYLDLMRRRLLENLPGLRILLSNRDGRQDLRLRIEDAGLEAGHVKSPDLSCDCVRVAPGKLQIRVPPGEAFHLILTETSAAPLRLTLPERGERIELEKPVPGRTTAMEITPESWSLRAGEPPAVGLALWTPQGHRAAPAHSMRDESSLDPEVLESLRALGYIE